MKVKYSVFRHSYTDVEKYLKAIGEFYRQFNVDVYSWKVQIVEENEYTNDPYEQLKYKVTVEIEEEISKRPK